VGPEVLRAGIGEGDGLRGCADYDRLRSGSGGVVCAGCDGSSDNNVARASDGEYVIGDGRRAGAVKVGALPEVEVVLSVYGPAP
jgi:hypothetical protein